MTASLSGTRTNRFLSFCVEPWSAYPVAFVSDITHRFFKQHMAAQGGVSWATHILLFFGCHKKKKSSVQEIFLRVTDKKIFYARMQNHLPRKRQLHCATLRWDLFQRKVSTHVVTDRVCTLVIFCPWSQDIAAFFLCDCDQLNDNEIYLVHLVWLRDLTALGHNYHTGNAFNCKMHHEQVSLLHHLCLICIY